MPTDSEGGVAKHAVHSRRIPVGRTADFNAFIGWLPSKDIQRGLLALMPVSDEVDLMRKLYV